MDNKNLNLTVSAVVFVLGAIFVLSDNAGITANVVGFTGDNYAVASIMGVIMIVASATLFIMHMYKSEKGLDYEVRKLQKEQLYDKPNEPEKKYVAPEAPKESQETK